MRLFKFYLLRLKSINIFYTIKKQIVAEYYGFLLSAAEYFVLKNLESKKLNRISSNHVIEIMIISKRYSLWIPCMIKTRVNETIANNNPIITIHFMPFSRELAPLKTGNKTKNEIIMNRNPISSSTIKIPCGLNCVSSDIPSYSPDKMDG